MCVTAAALDAPVAALITRCGLPAAVTQRDDGAHFTFHDGGATVDAIVDADRANVRALDVRAPAAQSFTVTIDGKPRTLAFGSTTYARANADLNSAMEYSDGHDSAFKPDEAHELVLLFDPSTNTLTRLFLGDGGAMGQLIDIPRPLKKPPFPYTAPVLKQTALTGTSGTQTTIARIDVDKFGIVRTVTVVVPSGDSAFDDALKTRLSNDRYSPARVSDHAVGGSVYRELRH